MKILKAMLALSIITVSAQISFAQQGIACVKGVNNDYTENGPYAVPYYFVNGDQLNEATNSYKYYGFNNYAVVIWPNGGYSAYEFHSWDSDISEYGYESVRDQSGRSAKIRRAPTYSNQCPNY